MQVRDGCIVESRSRTFVCCRVFDDESEIDEVDSSNLHHSAPEPLRTLADVMPVASVALVGLPNFMSQLSHAQALVLLRLESMLNTGGPSED